MPQDKTETEGLMSPRVSYRAQHPPLQALGSATYDETLGKSFNLSLSFFIHKLEMVTARFNEINTWIEPAEPGVYMHFLLLPSKIEERRAFPQREIQLKGSEPASVVESYSTFS